MTYKFEQIAYNLTAKRFPTKADMETYIGLEHLESGSLDVHEFGCKAEIKGEKLIMTKGDVLLGKRNAYLRRAAIAPHDGLFSAHGMILRPKEDVINKDYFPFFIASDIFFDEAVRISVGGLSPTINWKDLKVVEFDLPSLEEQKVLADKLWAAYRVKESYRQLLTATDDMLKAKFQKIADEAAEKRLGNYIEIIRGVSFKPTDLRSSEDDGATTILRANNISNGTLNFDDIVFVASEKVKDVQLLRKGDVLMCASSGSQEHVGKVALVDKTYNDVAFGAFCMVVRAKDIEPAYLLSLLMSTSFRNHIEMMCNGTNILNVRREYVEDWMCPVVDKEVQQQFATIATQAEATKAPLRQSIESIDRVIRSLINQ